MAIGHTTSLFYCKLGGSRRLLQPATHRSLLRHTCDWLAIYRTVRTTQLKMNKEENKLRTNYFELTSANEVKCKLSENTFFSLSRGRGGGGANNRLIFARAVRFSNLIMVSFWHPYWLPESSDLSSACLLLLYLLGRITCVYYLPCPLPADIRRHNELFLVSCVLHLGSNTPCYRYTS